MARVWNVANLLTLARLGLAPVVFWAIASGRSSMALALLGVAAVTDLLDGLAARRWGIASEAGQLFDPVADKVLLSCVYIALAWAGKAPLWFMAVIFGRDLVLLIASSIVLLRADASILRPSIWGKASTVLQIATALWLVSAAGPAWYFVLPTALLTTLSAMHYVWRGARLMSGTSFDR